MASDGVGGLSPAAEAVGKESLVARSSVLETFSAKSIVRVRWSWDSSAQRMLYSGIDRALEDPGEPGLRAKPRGSASQAHKGRARLMRWAWGLFTWDTNSTAPALAVALRDATCADTNSMISGLGLPADGVAPARRCLVYLGPAESLCQSAESRHSRESGCYSSSCCPAGPVVDCLRPRPARWIHKPQARALLVPEVVKSCLKFFRPPLCGASIGSLGSRGRRFVCEVRARGRRAETVVVRALTDVVVTAGRFGIWQGQKKRREEKRRKVRRNAIIM